MSPMLVVLLAASLLLAVRGSQARGESDEWLPVRDVSLAIVKGSPLDFSHLVSPGPAGRQGRVVVRQDGRLAPEMAPEAALRFHCASLAWSPASGSYPDKETAETYAEQLRRHGYNLARLHFVDANLMSGRDRDFDFDPEQLDRFRYLLAALKRNGIYWMIDAQTSENGAIGGVHPHRWEPRHDLKLEVHISESARRHWLRLVEAILGTRNPYTGLRPLDDPALAIVTAFNEGGLEYASQSMEGRTGRAYPIALEAPFNDWLAEQYKSTKDLATAWGGLRKDESLERLTIRLPGRRSERGPRMRDLQRFFVAREVDTFAWMSATLKRLGFAGPTTAYNNWDTTAAHLSRQQLPLVSLDSYFDLVPSLDTGVTISQRSSLDDGAGYVRAMMATRWHGRPFVIAEHDHLFWNEFRRESGLVVPAYAALQGWDGVCRHGMGAIDLDYEQPWPHKQKILPFGPGLDPIARASETLAALLFLRGDVATARGALTIPLSGEADLIDDGQGALPADATRLGLLTAIGLGSTSASPAERQGTSVLLPGIKDRSNWLPGWLGKGVDRLSGADDDRFAARLDNLALEGRIPARAAADAKRRIYRADTGEIVMDSPRRRMQVATKRTEAAAFERVDAPIDVGKLRILAATTPALVAVSALDGAPLETSRRILVVLATDAVNSGMRFHDAGRRTVADFGRLPVVIRRGTVKLALRLAPLGDSPPERTRVTSLRLDGLPVTPVDRGLAGGNLTLELDNGATGHGPTTYFLIER